MAINVALKAGPPIPDEYTRIISATGSYDFNYAYMEKVRALNEWIQSSSVGIMQRQVRVSGESSINS
eukprot:CAMPEP_0170430490 /NCGR_PEP_ID=MMETSP0117_2-20130122/40882_1 /TAXON_ID=400756 /ORGANISM="Durinskia baltica, Strain CSIRO CS-38" /LENGTH=66 /DNA_ID=CAMNT_0010689955 /DNA_START=86 /DNA_END=282 /DNA_ORIENTATION=-